MIIKVKHWSFVKKLYEYGNVHVMYVDVFYVGPALVVTFLCIASEQRLHYVR